MTTMEEYLDLGPDLYERLEQWVSKDVRRSYVVKRQMNSFNCVWTWSVALISCSGDGLKVVVSDPNLMRAMEEALERWETATS